jgi:LacI family transcriptional regulator
VLSIAISLDIEEQMLTELAVLEQQRVEGIIMFPPPTYNTPFLDYCHRFRERIVTIGLPIIGASVSGVQTNNIEATAKATKHLLEHGCKRILFLISNPQLQSMQERRQGYEQAMAQAGLKPLICEKLDSFETTEAAIVRAYRSRGSIDGLLTANGVLGVYAFQALQKHRIAIPKKVAFISFDDFELADTLRPAVTCIAQPVEELARIAMELLFTQLKAQRPRSRKIELPGELVIRTSCGCK